MLHRPTYQVTNHFEGKFAVATIDLAQGRQNGRAESRDGRYQLIFFGSIYESWVNREGNLADRVMERWVSGGWKALADLNGEYLIVVWDSQDERLTVLNDRLGLKRLNYWYGHQAFAFASEVKSLAVIPEVSRATDEQALSELLIFGHLQDDRTLLRDVKLMWPACHLTWQHGKLSMESYWRFSFRQGPALNDLGRTVDEYAYHVRNAVKRRMNGNERCGLFLSGGYDSRVLAGFIRRVSPSGVISTYTTGHGHDHDSRYAGQIAKAIGSEHHSVEVPRTYLQDFICDYAWILDGAVTGDGCHRGVLNPFTEEEDMPFFNGFLGDVLSGGKPLDDLRHVTDFKELVSAGMERYGQGFDRAVIERILENRVYNGIAGLAQAAFAQTVRDADVDFPADRVVCAELMQRERMGNPRIQVEYSNASCQMTAPFTDRYFIDFALRLPVNFRLERRAYVQMICREFPKLGQVPKSGDGLPLTPSRLRASIHWRWVLFERNTLPKVTGGLWRGHNYAAFVHCEDWFRNSNREFIERTLIDNPVLEEHFQMDALNTVVRGFLDHAERRISYVGIASLISFAIFRKKLNELSALPERTESLCAAS